MKRPDLALMTVRLSQCQWEGSEPRLTLGLAHAQVPYLFLIWQTLRAAQDSPMLLLEVPHVSLRLQWRAKHVDDVAHAAAQVHQWFTPDGPLL